MALGPATSGTLLKKVVKAAASLLPGMLKKSGLPEDAAQALGAKANFWTGMTLGAGAALLGGGILLGALAGGTLLAPGILGTVLLNGAVAAGAVAAGGFLLREFAQDMGGAMIKRAIGALLGRKGDNGAERSAAQGFMFAPAAVPAFAVAPLKNRFAYAQAGAAGRHPRRGGMACNRHDGPRF